MNRVMNFSAGPSALPLSVLEKAQAEFLSYKGLGFNIMETSHRSKTFDDLHNGAIAKVKKLYNLDDDYAVLFLQGGGHMQFAQIPMNLATRNGMAQYVDTGVWTSKALKDAKILDINYEIVASSKDKDYSYIPQDIEFRADADYCYICSNNTVYGTQYKSFPSTHGAPLVVDSSSDLFSRKIDFKANNIGLFWGGAQKNAGPAGVTIVIIHKSLAERASEHIPTILRYENQVNKNSLLNTPPTFGIYMFDLVLDWINEQGGLEALNEVNKQKAKIIYDVIDSTDFYKGHAQKDSRSLMNVTFTTPNKDLDAKFVELSQKENMMGLKGHRLVGGLRASIYNAVSLESVKTLASFMKEFARKNG